MSDRYDRWREQQHDSSLPEPKLDDLVRREWFRKTVFDISGNPDVLQFFRVRRTLIYRINRKRRCEEEVGISVKELKNLVNHLSDRLLDLTAHVQALRPAAPQDDTKPSHSDAPREDVEMKTDELSQPLPTSMPSTTVYNTENEPSSPEAKAHNDTEMSTEPPAATPPSNDTLLEQLPSEPSAADVFAMSSVLIRIPAISRMSRKDGDQPHRHTVRHIPLIVARLQFEAACLEKRLLVAKYALKKAEEYIDNPSSCDSVLTQLRRYSERVYSTARLRIQSNAISSVPDPTANEPDAVVEEQDGAADDSYHSDDDAASDISEFSTDD